MSILEIKGLVKKFKDLKAVDMVDLEVREGEILGILGPNGAGKSTTISMISTLLKPDDGDILFEGESIIKGKGKIRQNLGLVPQDIALYPDLTGYENLEFFGKVYGLKGKVLKERIEAVLDIIGLKERAKGQVKKFSGGMKRRINIGAALLHSPKLLIMDEPTVGIDPQSRNHILETVKKLNGEGMTVIYTSHYMEEVEFLCDRIYIMDHGKIIAEGSKDKLKSILSKDDTVEIQFDIVTNNLLDQIKGLPVVKSSILDGDKLTVNIAKGDKLMDKVFAIAKEENVNVVSVNVKSPTLEDVFLHLTGRGLRD